MVPQLRAGGVPDLHALDVLAVTGVVVSLMIYVVMPYYTRFCATEERRAYPHCLRMATGPACTWTWRRPDAAGTFTV